MVVERIVIVPEGSGVTTVVVELLGWAADVVGVVVVEVVVELPSKFIVVLVELLCANAMGALATVIARTSVHTNHVAPPVFLPVYALLLLTRCY